MISSRLRKVIPPMFIVMLILFQISLSIATVTADLGPIVQIEQGFTHTGSAFVFNDDKNLAFENSNVIIDISEINFSESIFYYDCAIYSNFTVANKGVEKEFAFAFVYPNAWRAFSTTNAVKFNIRANKTDIEYSIEDSSNLSNVNITDQNILKLTNRLKLLKIKMAVFNVSIPKQSKIVIEISTQFKIISTADLQSISYIVDTAKTWNGNATERILARISYLGNRLDHTIYPSKYKVTKINRNYEEILWNLDREALNDTSSITIWFQQRSWKIIYNRYSYYEDPIYITRQFPYMLLDLIFLPLFCTQLGAYISLSLIVYLTILYLTYRRLERNRMKNAQK